MSTETADDDAQLGSSLANDDDAHHEVHMHEGIATQWELWSTIIGKTALPRLEQLREHLPTMTSAILSTADGLNLCAVGISPENVGRLAALNSSMFAVSSAQTEIVQGDEASPMKTLVHLTSETTHTVMVSLVQEPLGHLLLAVSARDVPLGTVVVNVRNAAEDIRTWLSGG
ncbi:hypothetical protein SAMN05421595_1041 [Austwickia chelonae]|uniref:Roadblock/LAMTOR2 domain-containing protein n=1 Tax=Austwickia chelonae NBRC 105200 TaxID=1184607 RepID=K6ULG4_9MICO|nr:hypothetical protein [Austwickia chelonae]GAB77226.1 hypothetical protein AUCHE_05_01310 [Austwickia chelonae NBRC 105200]SEW05585.1 hypothetical protein SAMN05421595_1041 [Austwickia chelonae]